MARNGRRMPGGGWLPTAFLVITFGLVCWLGWQAVDAGTSHRRTAEAVLQDYAGISADQLSRVIATGLDEVFDEAFEGVWRRIPADSIPSAEVVGRDLDDAIRDQGCRCRAFRKPTLLFIARSGGEGEGLRISPDSLAAAARPHLSALLDSYDPGRRRRTTGLRILGGDEWPGEPSALLYEASRNREGTRIRTSGFLVPLPALTELVAHWYAEHPLLPPPIMDDEPNDSTLFVMVEGPGGERIFASSTEFPGDLAATESLAPGYGSLVLRTAIRPEAAGSLVIGGLPNSRLPLLAILILVTMGVGIASVVQMRREQAFQRLREDFVSGVSHELRTPLAQIRMFADLQESGKLRTDEDRSRATAIIHRESRRLSHLVENILRFSSMGRLNGRGLPVESMDLSRAIEDGVDAIRPVIRDRGMELEVTAPDGLRALANREAVTRIVVNLLDNAAKYGPVGQTIRLRVEGDSERIRLVVSDDGPGIPRSERRRIWNAYHRLERDLKGKRPGTGIGLSVVADLASRLGADTRIEDAEGGGARFVVEFPRTRVPDPSREAEPSVAGRGAA